MDNKKQTEKKRETVNITDVLNVFYYEVERMIRINYGIILKQRDLKDHSCDEYKKLQKDFELNIAVILGLIRSRNLIVDKFNCKIVKE